MISKEQLLACPDSELNALVAQYAHEQNEAFALVLERVLRERNRITQGTPVARFACAKSDVAPQDGVQGYPRARSTAAERGHTE